MLKPHCVDGKSIDETNRAYRHLARIDDQSDAWSNWSFEKFRNSSTTGGGNDDRHDQTFGPKGMKALLIER